MKVHSSQPVPSQGAGPSAPPALGSQRQIGPDEVSTYERLDAPTPLQALLQEGTQSDVTPIERGPRADSVMDLVGIYSYAERAGGIDREFFGRLLTMAALDGRLGDVEARQLQNFLERHERPEDLRDAAASLAALVVQPGVTIERRARGRLFHFFLRRGLRVEALAPDGVRPAPRGRLDRAAFAALLERLGADGRLSTAETRRLVTLLGGVSSDDDLFWAQHALRRRAREAGWAVSERSQRRLDVFFESRLSGRLDRDAFEARLGELQGGTLTVASLRDIFSDLGGVFSSADLAWADRRLRAAVDDGELRFASPAASSACREYFGQRLAGYLDRPGLDTGLDDLLARGKITDDEHRAFKVALAHSARSGDFVANVLYVYALSRPELAEDLRELQEAISEFFRAMGRASTSHKIVLADGTEIDLTIEQEAGRLRAVQDLFAQQLALARRERAAKARLERSLAVEPQP